MTNSKKIGIITDIEFGEKHEPPYPKPSFFSFESPLRIKFILEYFKKIDLFKNEQIIKISPYPVGFNVLRLAHSKYFIKSIQKISKRGGGLINDEVFVTGDTYHLARKAVGGAIQAVEKVINGEISQSFAIIRPPGHHATRESASGLCIFNNIANAILYLRKQLNYDKKIAIVDIDDHFGDGLCQYFYEDPSVLYCSIHEFDYIDWDTGDFDELGEDEGEGTNINFPVVSGITNDNFLEFLDIITPVLKQFKPDLIIVAAGFDMYFDDPIGSCNLTSEAYHKFTKSLLQTANETCEGRLAFILEGGYSLVGLPFCIHAVIKALLGHPHEPMETEYSDFSTRSKTPQIDKIKEKLLERLKRYYDF